ncbi:MAG: 50S ribosomal protein L17 [Zetaproteobacteria bacterium]|nr:50S ribosomal protein L17 [Zetaproteobacteria bacterium]
MRHLKSYKKLGRESSHRRAMLRNLATSLVEQGKINTTLARAKELRPIVEKLVTLGKKGGLHQRRQAESYLFGKVAAKKLCAELGPRFKERQGGYTRIIKFGPRFGDGAEMCQIEFVDFAANEGKAKAEQA